MELFKLNTFEWARDPEGYESDGKRIRRRGNGELVWYQPHREHPPIHHQFTGRSVDTEVGPLHYDPKYDDPERYGPKEYQTSDPLDDGVSPPSDEGALLRFVGHFGLLGSYSGKPPDEQSLEQLWAQIRALAVFEVFGRRAQMVQGMKPRLSAEQAFNQMTQGAGDDVLNGYTALHMTIQLVPLGKAWGVQVAPRNLISYMWLRVAQELTEGIEWRRCEICGREMEVRCHDKRAAIRKYCEGAACKQRAYRLRQKGERK